MSRGVKVLIGAATVSQIPAILLLTRLDNPSAWLAISFAFIYWGLWFFYLWDIRQNSNVPKEKERRWWWTILLAGPFAEPVYFWRFLWPDERV